ncbi:Glycosyltransferase, GT2 family [Methylobacterium gossipiicola]|uniref:Glycosyltransferase, GT2 family n=2 Tax=Methylobacterium gossipiicola TaxID=582675 RepID=A0A1I2X7V3_9HYPH|nr:Glycosyltransferase, GT2 family [Methylobacterium gossipiicola]
MVLFYRRLGKFTSNKALKKKRIHEANLVRNSIFFDEAYYASQVDIPNDQDVAHHYVSTGWKTGVSPSRFFDSKFYVSRYRDVREAGWNPLIHYITHGAIEGRIPSPLFNRGLFVFHHPHLQQPTVDAAAECVKLYNGYDWANEAQPLSRPRALFDAAWYVASSPDLELSEDEAYDHYMKIGWIEGRDPNPLFDTDWYLLSNPDVLNAGIEPLTHFEAEGYLEGRKPNPLFDTAWYTKIYADIGRLKINPLTHFITYGESENRDPHLRFSTRWYRDAYPESAAFRWGVFAYYFRIGRGLGHKPHPTYADLLVATPGEGVLVTAKPSRGYLPPAQVEPYASWLEVNQESQSDRLFLEGQLVDLAERTPVISVVMPTYQSNLKLLSAAIDSVRSQIYTNWQLCICDDASRDMNVVNMVATYAAMDPRISWIRSDVNENISGASNRAAALATGEVIALLDHDDLLHPHALAEIAIQYALHPNAEIVYTDDDKIDLDGKRFAPQFKPGWSPTLLLSFMYLSHLFTFKRSLFERAGGFRMGFEGSQDFDLAIRLSEHAREIHHIPRILYHWRAVPGSTATSGDAKPEAFDRGRRAVQEAFDRRGLEAHVIHPEFARAARVGIFEPQFSDDGPSVTIIIPTKDKVELLRTCVESLKITTYRNFDVLIVDNESSDPEALRYMAGCGAQVLRVASPTEGFSFAHNINAGVAAAAGDYVLLLNNDTEVITPRWLSQMVGYAQMEKVGAVGARLLYGDKRIQHAGITHGLHEGMAGHSFKLLPDYDLGYMCLARATREVAGVTAACMLTPKTLFLDIGGLDEVNFRVAYNDVDYCYRLVDAGYSCIQCGSAELYHHEGKSRGFGDNPAEELAMRRKYSGRVDQFYNPNLTLRDEQFGVARTHVARSFDRPIRTLFVSHNFNFEGAPSSLFELASGLVKQGRIDPVVIAPIDGPMRERYKSVGIPTITIEHPLREWPAQEEMSARLLRLGQTFLYAGIEVVVANTAESFWAVEAAQLVGLPCVWIIRESEPWNSYYAHLPRHLEEMGYRGFESAYRVVFVARSTLDAWSPLNTRGAFTLIRNGLNASKLVAAMSEIERDQARTRMAVKTTSIVFTVVGTVCERKGQLDLVEAYAALPDKLAAQAEIMIVGDRPSDYSEKLNQAVENLPTERAQRVHVIPETNEVPIFLKGSDVFICSSRVESYPRVTLEAMAAGLPLISTPVWGIREQVRQDYNAFLYEPGDIGELSRYMARLIEDKDLRRRFAERSLIMFGSLPSYDFMLDQYGSLVEQAVGTRS